MTGVAKALHNMNCTIYVCDATNATRVAAIRMTVVKIGPTTLSRWPRGWLARSHRMAFNPLITAKWPE
jgi:hypothetical protein